MTAIETVVFDIGETLVDDTGEIAAWARWLQVPLHTFSAVWGAARALGRDEAEIFEYFWPEPGFDRDRELQRRAEAGVGERIREVDLYQDARPALAALRARGMRVGIAGNQTAAVADLLRGLQLPVDMVATSGEWGVRKPDRGFFNRVVAMCGGRRATILYVGDRPDRDIHPARAAGLRTAWIQRGVQGYLAAGDTHLRAAADYVISSLTELADLLRPTS
jgi:HAD superfamily hydrolase (TIGR01662 family)